MDKKTRMTASEIYLMDCMEGMKKYPDKYFDLAIVDPPYRDENQPTKDMRRNGSMKTITGRPSKNFWLELNRVSKNQIIWGANNFELPQWMGFIVWKKKTIGIDFTMSMCEIASLSEGLATTSKFIEIAPQGTSANPRIHPNQKPVKLYDWLLQKYAQKGDKILDTHGGSMSSVIACLKGGINITCFEIDKEYFEKGKQRIENYLSQGNLFMKQPEVKFFQ